MDMGSGFYAPFPLDPSLKDGGDGTASVTDLDNFWVIGEYIFDRLCVSRRRAGPSARPCYTHAQGRPPASTVLE